MEHKFSEDFFEHFLAKVAERFSAASNELTNVRCFSQSTLKRELISIRDELSFKGHKNIPAKTLINHLVHSGLLQRVSVDTQQASNPIDVYTIGFEATSTLTPIELLTAIDPDGVVCFFSALQIYDLTTQLPSHHNVAKLIEPKTTIISRNRDEKSTSTPSSKKRDRTSVGTFVFKFNDVSYYRNRRNKHLVPGIKTRYLGSKTIYSLTTLEQTLLDTLQYPLHCGGPPIVFEAWENALGKIDEERLLEHLSSIGSDIVSRRAATMLALLDHKTGNELSGFFDEVKDKIDGSTSDIPLLSGMDYHELDKTWLTRIP